MSDWWTGDDPRYCEHGKAWYMCCIPPDDPRNARIAELEKVAEAAEKYLTKKGIGNVLLYDGLFNALRAAGYLK